MEERRRIFGIDPGTAVTGYGIIEWSRQCCHVIDYGSISIPTEMALPERYFAIFDCLVELITVHQPHDVSLETQFVQKNPQSALKVGMARGVAIVAAKLRGATVFEYAPCRVKKAVTGSGRAAKEVVQRMVQRLLGLSELPKPYDAADALALALCHAYQLRELP